MKSSARHTVSARARKTTLRTGLKVQTLPTHCVRAGHEQQRHQ